MKALQAAPNAGHIAISDFIRGHPIKRAEVITQNVDDLYASAGCTRLGDQIMRTQSAVRAGFTACGVLSRRMVRAQRWSISLTILSMTAWLCPRV